MLFSGPNAFLYYLQILTIEVSFMIIMLCKEYILPVIVSKLLPQ